MNEKINNIEQICSIKKLCFVDGRAKGQNILLVNNGILQFEVLIDKCMDIGQLYHKGTNISFISASGFSSFSGEFDDVYNGGMLYTCGLDTVGGRKLPIHGKVHNIPATIISCICNQDNIEILGEVYQTSLFGDKLKLTRTIKTSVNSSVIEINDKVTNIGYVDSEYCLLYHTNLGYPMLDEGVEIIAPIIETFSRTRYAKERESTCLLIESPKAYNEECVYFHKLNSGNIKVLNKKLNKVFTMEYDNKKLPHFIEWKSMLSGAYALGIEPATTTLDEDFKKTKIKAQDSQEFSIKIDIKEIDK